MNDATLCVWERLSSPLFRSSSSAVGPPRIRLFGYSPPFGPASRSKSAVPVLDAAADGGGGGKKAFPLAGRVSDGNGAVMGGRTVRPVGGLAEEDVEGAVPGAGIEARDDDSSWCRSLRFSSCRRIVSSCILNSYRGLATGRKRGSAKPTCNRLSSWYLRSRSYTMARMAFSSLACEWTSACVQVS